MLPNGKMPRCCPTLWKCACCPGWKNCRSRWSFGNRRSCQAFTLTVAVRLEAQRPAVLLRFSNAKKGGDPAPDHSDNQSTEMCHVRDGTKDAGKAHYQPDEHNRDALRIEIEPGSTIVFATNPNVTKHCIQHARHAAEEYVADDEILSK